ncbi:PEP-CTERM sorting domain-containing protein [Colwellia sp. 6M3]|uniref:PEP-CTERM sorting domain-containing protein n=1 Tax=Colwellia sp. 6M3 TaxID=2759849 RepID=UPI0015F3E777|nr:PEP-CTERM sorting domain-containing protein [Colwellia sp. 6M3]MBA6417264.1 PEP-CTERM sorting domain-containing protein [Colwellia sp. 6M3]
MKKLVNAFAIVASFAFSSIANAGLINSFDDSYLDSLVTGGSTVTQLLSNSNSIDYTFKDNFMVIDVNYSNLNYLVYEFSVIHEDGLDGTFLSNLYLPTGYTDALFLPVEELLEVVFQFGKADGFKFALEIDSSLDFLGVDIGNPNVGDFAFILSDDFQTNENIAFGNPLIGVARVDATVPEPSTLAIFALGMFGLASRKFNNKN